MFGVLPTLLFAATAFAGDVRVDIVDVGQGDAIVIRTPANKTVLIDAGDRGDDVVSKLAALGVDHLDLAIASHPHADHIGSMDAVVLAFPPKLYVDNGMAHTTQTYESVMKAVETNPAITYKAGLKGQTFNLDDGAKIEVLLPGEVRFRDTRSDLNSNSVVVRLTHGDDCFLFTGDAEEPTERALLEQGVGTCDVLKVAHHGSGHSSIASFLAAVKPTTAVISVGTGNRYKHPGDETLTRLGDVGATIYRTDRDGTVTLISDGKRIRITTEHPERGGGNLVSVAAMPGEGNTSASTKNDRETGASPATASAHDSASPKQSAAPDAGDAEACPFPASSKSEVFHEAGCGNAMKIGGTNLVCYPTKAAAEAAGKRSAGCCKP